MRTFAFLILAAIAGAGIASAQLKIAIVNSQKAILDTEEIKKAQKDLEAKYKPRQDQMAKLEKELQDIQAQLQSGKLNQLGEQELTAQGQKKQRELQRVQQDLQEDVDRERNDVLVRAGTRMQEVLGKLAAEKGLDLVLDSASTHYFRPTLDLTNDAVAAYNKAYPVK
ncbi:MAG TPA: OmpH family outer membrane protein [Bryobacteraceae bacterium]|nr:OmpH family outer membrane protein [Bryobacteraceae bacterium]